MPSPDRMIRRGKLRRFGMGSRPISLLVGSRPTKAATGSWSERTASHTGTETRPRLLREAAVGNLALMRESVTQRRRVRDEGPRVVNRWRQVGEIGIPGVAVKCADIRRNTGGEGGSLGLA